MKNITYNYIDKTNWRAGIWQTEPDKEQWQDAATGLPCLAVRHRELGHWCGYVGVTAEHPLFNKSYDIPEVSVHGGLTFADGCQESDREHGICHLPEAGESDKVFWFGFDCAHSGDASPAYPMQYGTYKTLAYVKAECASLAAQLKSQA